jgi:hypothetical protein
MHLHARVRGQPVADLDALVGGGVVVHPANRVVVPWRT